VSAFSFAEAVCIYLFSSHQRWRYVGSFLSFFSFEPWERHWKLYFYYYYYYYYCIISQELGFQRLFTWIRGWVCVEVKGGKSLQWQGLGACRGWWRAV
jgi:hypothetical protein